MLYLVGEILDTDEVGRDAKDRPERYVRKEADRDHLRNCLEALLREEIIPEVNSVVEEATSGDNGAPKDFDYRDKLRSESWVKDLKRVITKEYAKSVARKKTVTFGQRWSGQAKAG